MMRFVGLALCAALVACGDSADPAEPLAPAGEVADADAEPSDVLQRFYDALGSGDYATARALLLPMADAQRQSKLEQSLGLTGGMMQSGEIQLAAHEHRIEGDWAVVVTRHELLRDGAREVLVRDEFLFRTPAGWRIATEAMRSDAAIRPLWNGNADGLLNWFRTAHPDLLGKYR